MKFLATCVTLLLAYADCFIIPEEFPSLLSLVYSNIPPVKKGTDSRVGLGFRLGPHADFQILLELGPQKSTEPLGPPTSENTAKRETIVMNNPDSLVDYVNNIRKYFQPEKKKTGNGKVSETEGGKWIDWWRNNVLTQKKIGKIEFNKIPGIDDRVWNDDSDNGKLEYYGQKSVFDHFRQLYKTQSADA